MTDTPEREGLTAVLLQLAGLTQKLSGLEHRQAADAGQIHDKVTALATGIDQARAAIASHADALTVLDTQVTGLAARLDQLAPSGGSEDGTAYKPPPSPRFWKLDGPDRDQATGKLRAWVEQVYRPGYGHLAAGLGDCWDQHPLCLYLLDWLSELWSVLYLQPTRTPATLAVQAEWHTRLLPAAAEQLARETRGCSHRTPSPYPGISPAGARP